MPAVDDLTDFLWQMKLAVLEQTWLYDIPRGSIDSPGPHARHHGPWPGPTCAAILRLWYRQGWIGLHFQDLSPDWDVVPAEWQDRRTGGDLAAEDAHALLGQPERWTPEHADGFVMPYRTVDGEITPNGDWYAHVIETARSLPLRG
ncbi:MAG TPA: hypothetical protein VN408_02355 [Actinoplanes sp.]|nr:hypothetical protein [Actinoplanes sp.]